MNKKKDGKRTIQQNMILKTVILLSCIIVLLGISIIANEYNRVYKINIEKINAYTNETARNLEEAFEFVSNTIVLAATETSVLEWCKDPSYFEEKNENYVFNRNRYKEELKKVFNYSSAWNNRGIAYISVFENDKLLLYTYTVPKKDIIIERHLQEVYDSEQINNIYNTGLYYFLSPVPKDDTMYAALKIAAPKERESNLIILLGINNDAIENTYEGKIEYDTMLTLILDEDNKNLYSRDMQDDEFIKQVAKYKDVNESIFFYKGVEYECITKNIKTVNLSLVNVIPKNSINKMVLKELTIILYMICLVFLISIIVVFCMSKRNTQFIKDLDDAMEAIKDENYAIRLKPYSNKAENDLSETFNNMTMKMEKLINEEYKSKILYQELELEMIQQQVNPHFLFNILTIIQIKAKMLQDDTIYHMLKALSGFLRASLYSEKNARIPIGKELEYTEFYLYLQKQRFEEQLQYSISLPEHLGKYELPRLTIEPLVENSVIHGMNNLNRSMEIKIKVEEAEHAIRIEVCDNGIGFDVKSLHTDDCHSLKREKIGLRNTGTRLQLLYNSELHIESKIGEGTIIWFELPKY